MESYDAVVVGGGHNGLVAAVSFRAFPGVDVRLSRYSYLVSLLPRKIIADLGSAWSCDGDGCRRTRRSATAVSLSTRATTAGWRRRSRP
jgi:hypothetical protein